MVSALRQDCQGSLTKCKSWFGPGCEQEQFPKG